MLGYSNTRGSDLLRRITYILTTIVLVSSCNSDSDSDSPSITTTPDNTVSIAIPTARSPLQLPEEGIWHAFVNILGARDLTCDAPIDADTCELSADTAAGKATGRIDLAAGTYSGEVVWEYRDPAFINSSRSDGRWLIADAQKSVTIVAGGTSPLIFTSEDYKPLHDEDGDEVSDLVELDLKNRTDPGDPNDRPTSTVAVPNIVGLTEPEARSQIVTAGLVVGSVTREFSETIEKDRVIRQDPTEGELVIPGSSVNFVVSDGVSPEPFVPVPDCVNKSEADCKGLIETAGLRVGIVTEENSETIPRENVIRTIPEKNTMVPKESTVDIVVSLGPSVQDGGLIAFYPFNGNAEDESGNNLDGTVNGPVLTTDRSGKTNSAYSFDGNDDDITVSTNSLLNIRDQISIAAWIYPTAQKTQEIIRKGAAVNGATAAPYGLSLSGTGDIVFSLRPNLNFTQARKSGYPLNQWTFVVGTYDGASMKLYVNGNLETSVPVSGTLNTNNSPLLIGTRLNLPADTFQGKLDDLRVYSGVLTEAKVATLFEE